MDNQEAHDLLIRIDTRLGSIETRMGRMEVAQSKRLCHTNAEKIKTLEQRVKGKLPCQTNSEKIRTVEKIVWGVHKMAWGALIVSAVGVVKVFLFGGK